MKWKEFAKKISPKLKGNESIGLLGFTFKGKKYSIVSPWGSGEKRENVCLWGKKIGDKSTRIYPFQAEEVDKMKFFRI